MRGLSIAAVAVSLVAPQALSQTGSNGASLVECRLPLRDAMQAALKFPVLKREKEAETGDVTAVLQPAGLNVIGQPVQAFNVTRSTWDTQTTTFTTLVALDYPAVKAALPKAYGKTKCDVVGTAITYCQMTMPEDASTGARHRVTMSAEPAEGGGTMLSCLYEKLDS